MQRFTVIAVITEYLSIVKYNSEDKLYGLLFAAGTAASKTIQFKAKNNDFAIMEGTMLAKERGFI